MGISMLAVLAFVLYAGVRPSIAQPPVCAPYVNYWPTSVPFDLSLSPASNPLGFSTFTYPNPERNLLDPCVSVTGAGSRYVLVPVQAANFANSRICVRQVNSGLVSPGSCGSGTVVYCAQAISNSPTINFYCDGSCDISDVLFYYRVNISDVTVSQDEYWCDTYSALAEANLPSSLLANDPHATQTGTLQLANAAPLATPTLMVVLGTSLFAAVVSHVAAFV